MRRVQPKYINRHTKKLLPFVYYFLLLFPFLRALQIPPYFSPLTFNFTCTIFNLTPASISPPSISAYIFISPLFLTPQKTSSISMISWYKTEIHLCMFVFPWLAQAGCIKKGLINRAMALLLLPTMATLCMENGGCQLFSISKRFPWIGLLRNKLYWKRVYLSESVLDFLIFLFVGCVCVLGNLFLFDSQYKILCCVGVYCLILAG